MDGVELKGEDEDGHTKRSKKDYLETTPYQITLRVPWEWSNYLFHSICLPFYAPLSSTFVNTVLPQLHQDEAYSFAP